MKRMEDTEAYIIDAVRSPVGKFRGSLSHLRADDLAAHVLSELMNRNPKVPAEQVDDLYLGCANQAGEDNRNIARMALLLAGLPESVPAETVNRLCASGMSAAIHAYRAIKANDANIVISGGIEHMTRSPWVMSKPSTPFGSDSELYDSSFGWRFVNPKMRELYGTDAMGITAENLAVAYEITRMDQDRFAASSQQKAATAQNSGRFSEEISPVTVTPQKGKPFLFSNDEFLRPDTTTEILSGLKPAFKQNGTVTAGNASGLNDGAAAMLISSGRAVKEYELFPVARIVSSGIAGVLPKFMGIGPVKASEIALRKANLTLSDIDIIEINEAFSAQVLACTRTWGLPDNDPRINPNGGAISIGHPLGMSGTRILQTAALELRNKNKKRALVTMCVGVGQGYAVILENACN